MKTNNNYQVSAVQREIERSLKNGMSQVTIKKLTEIIKGIGYRFDRSMDTCSQAQIMTGNDAGDSYPTRVLYPVQDNDGVSVYHYQARRDENYQKLKEIRNNFFAVSNNRIVVI